MMGMGERFDEDDVGVQHPPLDYHHQEGQQGEEEQQDEFFEPLPHVETVEDVLEAIQLIEKPGTVIL